MKPWGFIHNGCCGLPIFNEHQNEKTEQSEQEVPNTISIEERVKELEKLLKCVINDTRKNRSNSNKNRRNDDNNSSNNDNNSGSSDNSSSGSSIYSNNNDSLNV